MAESRRKKRFLRLSIFCTGSAASAAITGPLAWVDAGLLDQGNAGPWFQGIAGPLVQGNAGSLVSGQCRPLDPGIHPNCFEIQD